MNTLWQWIMDCFMDPAPAKSYSMDNSIVYGQFFQIDSGSGVAFRRRCYPAWVFNNIPFGHLHAFMERMTGEPICLYRQIKGYGIRVEGCQDWVVLETSAKARRWLADWRRRHTT